MKDYINYFLVSWFLLTFININAQGDGPRAWWPAPNETNVFTPLYMNISNSNQIVSNNIFFKDLDVDTNIYGLMYTRVFSVNERPLGLIGVLTGGSIKGNISGQGLFDTSSNEVIDVSGLADFQILGVYSLYGANTISSFEEMMEVDKYNLLLNVVLGVKIPIGSYDSNQIVNLGANRWEFRLGLPMMKFLNWGKPHVTSFEFIPNAFFYTKNNDFFNGAELTQNPVFTFEGHVTQGINRMLWVSLDGFYKLGGETAIDNTDSDNSMNGFALGGSLGAYFSENINIKFSYGELLSSDDNLKGTMFRVLATYMF